MGATGTGYIAVKNFERFQHYRDRTPPWIKLYNDLLDDYQFACLQDASKLHLVMIWLLASRYENRIPNDAAWIAKRINATEPVDIIALVSAGFITVVADCEQDASDTLAECADSANPEGEREVEEETTSASPDGAAGRDEVEQAPLRRKRKRPEQPSWTFQAAEVWEQEVKGEPPAARIGKALKPLVEKHGADDVLHWWRQYLKRRMKDGEAQFASPQDFAARYGAYKENGGLPRSSNGNGRRSGPKEWDYSNATTEMPEWKS